MAIGQIISGGGGGGGFRGASSRGYNPASGGIPGVTSPIDAITGNLGGLSGLINAITGSQSSSLRDQYPDEYFSTLGTLLGNTGRRAAGDISDLLPELQQNSAEDAVYGGMSGSEAENTKLLRDLGLTRYGVQNEAINSLGKIQGQIPTVRPFDPSGVIAAQLAAQERADMYASAPVPEDAYQRAMRAAGGGGGGTPWKNSGGGGGGGGSRGGGGPSAPVDTIMRGYGAPTIGYGTNQSTLGGGSAPWGSFPNAIRGSSLSDDDDWLAEIFGGDQDADLSGEFLSTDYGPQSPQGDDQWLAEIFGGDDGGYYDEDWY